MTHTVPKLLEPESLAPLPRADLLLVHVGDGAGYRQAHLPGARLVEPRELVSGRAPAVGELPEPARLEALFSRLGYEPAATIVIYDDEGGGWAGRFAWTLDIIGHADWSYLNGGIHAWHAAGQPLAAGDDTSSPTAPVRLTLNRAPIADAADVLAALDDPDQQIWDVRSAAEYQGLKSGSRRAGHIPGAVHLDWMALKDPQRHQRLVTDLEERLRAHGVDPAKRVITHCQTHHRSGLSYLVGRLLAFRDIRAYAGSWADWGNRDDTPVVTGS